MTTLIIPMYGVVAKNNRFVLEHRYDMEKTLDPAAPVAMIDAIDSLAYSADVMTGSSAEIAVKQCTAISDDLRMLAQTGTDITGFDVNRCIELRGMYTSNNVLYTNPMFPMEGHGETTVRFKGVEPIPLIIAGFARRVISVAWAQADKPFPACQLFMALMCETPNGTYVQVEIEPIAGLYNEHVGVVGRYAKTIAVARTLEAMIRCAINVVAENNMVVKSIEFIHAVFRR